MASPSDEANRRAFDAMDKAMQARGFRTVRALVQALNEAGYRVSERAVGAWRNREASMPAWALVAFSEISGLSLNSLTGGGGEGSDPLAQTVADQERALAELRERIGTLDTEMDKMGSLLAHLIGVLEEEGISIAARSDEGRRVEAEPGERRAARDR